MWINSSFHLCQSYNWTQETFHNESPSISVYNQPTSDFEWRPKRHSGHYKTQKQNKICPVLYKSLMDSIANKGSSSPTGISSLATEVWRNSQFPFYSNSSKIPPLSIGSEAAFYCPGCILKNFVSAYTKHALTCG